MMTKSLDETSDKESISTTRNDVPLLDQHLVDQHCSMLGRVKFTKLIDQLQQQCEQLTVKMEQTRLQRNDKEFRNIAHQLAGASANFGLQALSLKSKALEEEKETVTESTNEELNNLLGISLKELRQRTQQDSSDS